MPTIKKLPRRVNTATPDTERRRERHEIYDTQRWRRLRDCKFADQPICEICLQKGIITPADEIHHRVSFMSVPAGSERTALAFDYDNLMSLCRSCHQQLHSERDGGRNFTQKSV